jgi:hypothetical protein
MKYFSYDLHLAQNTDGIGEEELAKVDNEWEKNCKEYTDIFPTLSNRLPHHIVSRFSRWRFHDYQLIKMEIEHKSLLHTNLHLILSSNDLWIVSFEHISFFQFRHLNADNDKPLYHREVDNWLYEEFLPVNESIISFEVIFSSGANINIHFPDKSILMKKLTE